MSKDVVTIYMSWIPDTITVKDVSYLFASHVPRFLEDLEKNPTLMLVVTKNETNAFFLTNIHPTDHTFYFYKDKYMSLPLDLTTVSQEELHKKGAELLS
jgi:hypothetical protein